MYLDQVSNVCKQCSIYCLACSRSQDQCDQCIADAGTNRKDITQNCQCQDGFYDDGSLICKKCPYNCVNCILQNKILQCTSCLDSSISHRKAIADSQQCNCLDGYYDNGVDSNCLQCPYQCQNCSFTTKAECTSCPDPTTFFRKSFADSPSCDCQDKYFDQQNKKCIPCDQQCLTCVQNATQCTSCDTNLERVLDGTICKCSTDYQEYQPPKLNCVLKLSCFETCKTCSQFQQRDKCETCSSERDLIIQQPDISFCQCKVSFFENSQNECVACDSTCKTCTNKLENSCLSCYEQEQFRVLDTKQKKCICKQGYVLINNQCQKCNEQCESCMAEDVNKCYTCYSSQNRYLKDNSCICNELYVQTGTNPICARCGINCQSCDTLNPQQCLVCANNSNRQLNTTNGSCNCKDGYFSSQGEVICSKCDSKCQTCVNTSTHCTSCASPLRILSQDNQCVCKDTYYEDAITTQCLECPKNCKHCNNSLKCLQCSDNFDLSPKSLCEKVFPSNISKNDIELVQKQAEKSVQVSVGTTVAGSVLLSSIQPNGNIAAQFILLQKLNFMVLINIAYPQLLYGFFKTFGGQSPISSLQSANLLNRYIVKDTQGVYLPNKFESEEIGDSIYYNSGGCITILVLLWLICLPFIILYKRNQSIREGIEIKQTVVKMLQSFCEQFYPIVVVLAHQVLSIIFCFSISLQFAALNLDHASKDGLFILKWVACFIVFVYLLFIIIKTYKMINSKENYFYDKDLHSSERIEKQVYLNINSQFKQNTYLKRNFKLIYMLVENIFFPLFIVFFQYNYVVQLSLCLFGQLFVCILTFVLQPMVKMLDNIFLMLEQLAWVIILSSIFAIGFKISQITNSNSTPTYHQIEILNILSWLVIASCLLILLANPIYLIIQFIANRKVYIASLVSLFNKIRNSLCRKRKNDEKQQELSLYDFSLQNSSKVWDKSTMNQRALIAAYSSQRQSPALTSISFLSANTPQKQKNIIKLQKSTEKSSEKSNFPSTPIANQLTQEFIKEKVK